MSFNQNTSIVQANEIETGFTVQHPENKSYSLTEMKFTDGATIFGRFSMPDQNPVLKSQNQWVFFFDEIKLVISGNDIASFSNIYS